MSGAYAIVAAAGQSLRMGIPKKNKVFLKLSGRSVLELALQALIDSECFEGIVIVTQEKDRTLAETTAAMFPEMKFFFADGGETRQASVYNALKLVPEDAEVIAVHDAARCFTDAGLIVECVESAKKSGSGVACRMSTDTVKYVDNSEITHTIDRKHIALAQTPQVFGARLLRMAHEKAAADGFIGTDDSQLIERLGIKPVFIESDKENLKLTYRSDIKKGESILRSENRMRIGNGIDIHAFAEGRRLVLGGVEIPSAKGLAGHSDADVLVHAIMDALLGAAGLPDIGVQFPDNDEQYKGISSIVLLEKTLAKLAKAGFSPVNIDSTLVLQAPKIAAFVPAMKDKLSGVCGCPVNIKATTPEKLGFVGRGEGAEAHAVALLQKN